MQTAKTIESQDRKSSEMPHEYLRWIQSAAARPIEPVTTHMVVYA